MDDGQSRVQQRGPYGTNKGDVWLSPGSDVQARLDAEGEGLVLIHEMLERDGVLEEAVYVTDNVEMIEEAEAGHVLWTAAQAARN